MLKTDTIGLLPTNGSNPIAFWRDMHMVLMNVKLNNFLIFDDFEFCTSYPKKIVNSGIGEEHLEGFPNFRYKKLIILMGPNASGKTAFGRVILSIYNFIYHKEPGKITYLIEDRTIEAFFSVDLAFSNGELWRVSATFHPNPSMDYRVEDIEVSVRKIQILANDNYEKCAERLELQTELIGSNFISILEKVPKLTWGFEFPVGFGNQKMSNKNHELFIKVLKQTLITLDPRIDDVIPTADDPDMIIIKYNHATVVMKDGEVLFGKNILSQGTLEGIGIAFLIASMKTHSVSFYYCDEKFSHIYADAEKAFLSLLIDLIGPNEQLFITSHNVGILDMNIPKHSFAFLRRDVSCDNHISCVFASEYLKKNTESLKNAVENDVFSSAPDLSGIYQLKDI